MKIISLGSGSKGNATLVEIGGVHLLIDNGFTLREITKRLDISFKDIRAVLLTHEHTDHLDGVGAVSRPYGIPVHLPSALTRVCEEKLVDCEIVPHFDKPFSVDGVEITPFRVPHDARYTVGYKLVKGEESFAILTDVGQMRPSIWENVKGVNTVFLESNYDESMLIGGAYPEALKKRIMGTLGHLSNEDSAKVTESLIKEGTKKIILGHLSENNNAPEIAFSVTAKTIEKSGFSLGEIYLGVAEQNKVKIF